MAEYGAKKRALLWLLWRISVRWMRVQVPELVCVLKDQVSLLLTRAFSALGALGGQQQRRSLSPEQSLVYGPEEQQRVRARPGSFVAADLVDLDAAAAALGLADPLDEFEFVERDPHALSHHHPPHGTRHRSAGAGTGGRTGSLFGPGLPGAGGGASSVADRAHEVLASAGGGALNIPIVQRVLRITRALLLNYLELLVCLSRPPHAHSHPTSLSLLALHSSAPTVLFASSSSVRLGLITLMSTEVRTYS